MRMFYTKRIKIMKRFTIFHITIYLMTIAVVFCVENTYSADLLFKEDFESGQISKAMDSSSNLRRLSKASKELKKSIGAASPKAQRGWM